MGGGQSGTYLRQTRASSSPRVSVTKTYRDETKRKYTFSQITVAFLSSRIQETGSKLFSVAGVRVECGGLTDVETQRCVWIRGQVGMQFQIGGGCGLGWSQVVCV